MSEKVLIVVFCMEWVSVMNVDNVRRDGIMYREDRVSDLQKVFVCKRRV
jgi:hypothetical protein